jgi:hypothetical protein
LPGLECPRESSWGYAGLTWWKGVGFNVVAGNSVPARLWLTHGYLTHPSSRVGEQLSHGAMGRCDGIVGK